ncbi:hypothetical protein [Micromonospora sp. WMMD975]|uniref:hypothetical protein n=1 Tax=Micromonospora sp. WMMD975 TaxID=3016087 RepID=UPI00249A1EFF|nr:hypothetical protein [Micromonospora sp. WMMD975]WFE32488.1 hypothetical protein O7613_23355 [Micromonospora sp. WMMD975]
MTGASFEAFHYVEVVTRNAIDRVMREHLGEPEKGIPWVLLPIGVRRPVQDRIDRNVAEVRDRLRREHPRKETRDQIIASLSFGFWVALLGSEHEQLWRDALHRSFPYSSGKRHDVASALNALRMFRNRLAHHDSLLTTDVPFRLSQMIEVARWADPQAAHWLARTERVTEVHRQRPAPRNDTVVVSARNAWGLYQAARAYVCQPVEHLAFYSQRQINQEVAKILFRLDNVDWTVGEINRLRTTGETLDATLAEIIEVSRKHGWTEGRYQVFGLTAPGSAGHLTLPAAIPHHERGRGSAFTQGQRYVVRDRLRRARSTADL